MKPTRIDCLYKEPSNLAIYGTASQSSVYNARRAHIVRVANPTSSTALHSNVLTHTPYVNA